MVLKLGIFLDFSIGAESFKGSNEFADRSKCGTKRTGVHCEGVSDVKMDVCESRDGKNFRIAGDMCDTGEGAFDITG